MAFALENDLVAGDGNPKSDIFVRDIKTATTTLISAAKSDDIDSGRIGPSIDAKGRLVAFASDVPDLVSNDGNDAHDVFVRSNLGGES